MRVDRELSRRIAGALDSEVCSAWRRAWLALQKVSELENSLYVEGWAVALDNQLVFEHAWLELNGCIVDPARWERKLTYFPGLRFDKSQLLNAMLQQPLLPVSWRYSESLSDSKAYDRARQAARIFARVRLAKMNSHSINSADTL